MQTGIYPGVFNANSNGGLTLGHETIAKKLYEIGYGTAHVGKWHLGVGLNKEYLPTVHGFERYYRLRNKSFVNYRFLFTP